jgi:hypothetical protein
MKLPKSNFQGTKHITPELTFKTKDPSQGLKQNNYLLKLRILLYQ